MNGWLILSLLVMILPTYQLIKIVKNKESPKSNKRLAWLSYGICVIALAIVITFFS